MSEMAPYKKNINFEKSSDFKTYFATRFASGNCTDDYIDLYFCEDVASEPLLDKAIYRAGYQTQHELVTESNIDANDADEYVEHGKAIIHGLLKMDSKTVLSLYLLLDEIIREMPDAPFVNENDTIFSPYDENYIRKMMELDYDEE